MWRRWILRRSRCLWETVERNNKRVDTLPALEAAEHGSIGFNGLGLKIQETYNEGSFSSTSRWQCFVARLLVSRLVPGALPADSSMNTILDARLDYAADTEGSAMRIRLNSPVVRVEHEGNARERHVGKRHLPAEWPAARSPCP